MRNLLVLSLSVLLLGLGSAGCNAKDANETPSNDTTIHDTKYEKATFAGGCFWCMEPPFDEIPGVISTTSGYTGGSEVNPTYKQVSYGKTGHTEAVQVVYDPAIVTYAQLLEVFWMNIDPTDPDGQFVDRGKQYRPGIFYHNREQKTLALGSRDKLGKSGRFNKPIATEITEATEFYPAEEYHQDFYKKSPLRYKSYRYGSGRDQFIERVWGNTAKK